MALDGKHNLALEQHKTSLGNATGAKQVLGENDRGLRLNKTGPGGGAKHNGPWRATGASKTCPACKTRWAPGAKNDPRSLGCDFGRPSGLQNQSNKDVHHTTPW